VVLITETNVPHADNVSYFGNGSNEAQMVYNFALPPLVFHTMRTGDATALCSWARSLAQPNGSATFFNFLASHDGIGLNPARGLLDEMEIDALVRTVIAHGGYVSFKRLPDGSEAPYELNVNLFDALSNSSEGEADIVGIGRFLAAHAIMLSLAGVPGIYFHSLFGSRGDRPGAEASGIPRRINREKLELERLEKELNSPGSLRKRVFEGMRGMLAARAEHPAFSPHSLQEILDLGPEVVAIRRGAEVLCLTNVTPRPVSLDLQGVSQWDILYGSSEREGARVSLPPYGVLWLAK
jgi:sucrose phosphorylase